MLPYWIAFLIAATGALTERSRLPTVGVPPKRPRGLNGTWLLVAVGLALFIGLRHEVGGDWYTYLENFHSIVWEHYWQNTPEWSLLLTREPGYHLAQLLGHRTGTGIYGTNAICAGIFAYGLVRFCLHLPRPWLALTAAIPYIVIVIAMGYTRQSVAIACLMAGLVWLFRGRLSRFALWVVVGGSFHQTVLVFLLYACLVRSKGWISAIGWSTLIAGLSANFIFKESIAKFSHGYLDASYQSEGALVRLAMNALPALLFIFARKDFALGIIEKRIYLLLSITALCLLALYFFISSSTALDRIGLYLTPLQVALFAYLPKTYSQRSDTHLITIASLSYFLATMFVWLFFATHSAGWIPYKSVLFYL